MDVILVAISHKEPTMSIAPLKHPRRRLPILSLLSGGFLLSAFILMAIEIVNFSRSRNTPQDEVVVAGITVGGLTPEEAQRAWESTYTQPVELRYGNSPIQLSPQAVGFHVNNDDMLKTFSQYSSVANNTVVEFWRYLWQQTSDPVNIDLSASYDQNALRNFLQDIASRY